MNDINEDANTGNVQFSTQEKYWTSAKLFSLVSFILANFSIGALYALLGPFFPQEVDSMVNLYVAHYIIVHYMAYHYNRMCICVICSSFWSILLLQAKKKGASNFEIGLIFGSFEVIIIITTPIFGTYVSMP